MREIDQELFYAVRQGDLSKVKRCLDQGANIYVKDSKGDNALHIAAANGHKDIVGFFLDQEYITDSVDVGGGITIASYQTVNVDSANTSGCTPLHYASRYGELEVVKFLVGKRANIYAGRSTDGCKALHLAALNGHKNVVEFFLNQGMSVSDSGKDGWTPLHYAAQGGCLEVVKFLTRKGASINVRDADGTKPVHSAALWGQKNVVEFFLDQGMSINTTGEIGFTLLHFAAQGNRTEITRFLLDRGADANIKNECGEKPIDVARRKGHSNIEGLLSSYTHPDCIILSTDSNRKQQEKFLCSISNADVRACLQTM